VNEIDIRKEEAQTIRFADGARNENNVYVQNDDEFCLAVIRDGDGKEAEIESEDVENLIKALKEFQRRVSDGNTSYEQAAKFLGTDYAEGPDYSVRFDWSVPVFGRAEDASGNKSPWCDKDYKNISPVEFRWGNDPDPIGEISIGGWVLHDGGERLVQPLDIVEVHSDYTIKAGIPPSPTPSKDVSWSRVSEYRPLRDENNIPYCSAEGLEPWAEYVATDEDKETYQFESKPDMVRSNSHLQSCWYGSQVKTAFAPEQYKNTSQHWTETIRRVWKNEM